MPSAPPVVLSLIICDSSHVEPTTRKRSLLGLFNGIGASQYPVVHPTMHIAAEFTNGHGTTPITLKIVRVTADSLEGDEIFGGSVELEFPDPRATVAFGLQVNGLAIPAPGEYRVVLESEGILLLERRFLAAKVDNQGNLS